MHDPVADFAAQSNQVHAATSSEPRNGPCHRVRTGRKGLPVRFVTRMSDDLNDAVATAARRDGLTAGAFVRRLLLERLDLQSPRDARSGRPIRRPDQDQAAIAAAIREVAAVSLAVAASDEAAARTGLDRVRSILIPMAVRRHPT